MKEGEEVEVEEEREGVEVDEGRGWMKEGGGREEEGYTYHIPILTGARPGGHADQGKDPGDTQVHHGCATRPTDHKLTCHIQEIFRET